MNCFVSFAVAVVLLLLHEQVEATTPAPDQNQTADNNSAFTNWIVVKSGSFKSAKKVLEVARIEQGLLLYMTAVSRLLTQEQREKLAQLMESETMTNAESRAAYKSFIESLPKEQEKAAAMLRALGLGQKKRKSSAAPASLNGTTLEAYQELKKIEYNDSITEIEQCEQKLAFVSKMLKEDRVKLKFTATGGDNPTWCRTGIPKVNQFYAKVVREDGH